jgi:hypothetical protein
MDDISTLIATGAQAYKTVTQPAVSSFSLAPYQGPNIDPRTGAYVPSPSYFSTTSGNYTVPLLLGGGLLLLMMMGRKK